MKIISLHLQNKGWKKSIYNKDAIPVVKSESLCIMYFLRGLYFALKDNKHWNGIPIVNILDICGCLKKKVNKHMCA